MNEQIEIGDPPIAITLKRSSRARRISLRVSSTGHGVSLTVPSRASRRAALDFARDHEGWLRRHLRGKPDLVVPDFGQSVLLDGQPHTITQGSGRRVETLPFELQVPGTSEGVPARLKAFLKTLARDRMTQASERYAHAVGREFTKITLRDTRSRWGSCTTDGNLMYSWRLVMAPRAVQDYVAAHEVCHLVHMNHSRAYWAQVAEISPDYKVHRKWLRDHGAQLHRYQF